MKFVYRMLTFLLAGIMTLCLTVVPAQAADYTFNATAGETAYFIMFSDETDFIEEAYIYEGSIPGMWLEVSGDVTLGLAGTPTTAGTYTVYISATTANKGGIGIVATVNVAAGESSAVTPVVTKNPTSETVAEGGTAYFVARADNVITYYWEIAIGEACIGCEDLPAYLGGGVTVSGLNTDTLAIGNIPMSLNGAYVWCQFVGEDDSVCSTAAQIFVTPGVPVVTMQPVNETVMEGGEATFTSTANYDTGRQWILVSPDGATYDPSALSNIFPDLQFAGTDQDSITLTNVPLEMDGYRIFCRFTSVGTADSNMATLYVTPDPEKEPVTEPTTEPTTEPPTEPPTEEPTEEPEPTSASKIPSSGKEKQKSQKADSTVLLIIVAIIAVAAVAIAAIVAFVILKLRKK